MAIDKSPLQLDLIRYPVNFAFPNNDNLFAEREKLREFPFSIKQGVKFIASKLNIHF